MKSEKEEPSPSKSEISEEEEDEFVLPEVTPPFLPQKASRLESDYTLVLDLDETLIHFVNTQDEEDEEIQGELEEGENDFFYMVRPYCSKFL